MHLNQLLNIINERRTTKVRIGFEHSITPKLSQEELNKIVSAAHNAPFHYPCHESFRTEELSSVVPWRFFSLDGYSCRKLSTRLLKEKTGIETIEAITEMLNAAEGMSLVYWLPNELDSIEQTKGGYPSQKNMENIAAASAAVQNVLLAATSNKLLSYWYSGGLFRFEEEVLNWLKIPLPKTLLLGAIFFFPNTNHPEAKKIPGAWKNQRGRQEDWMRSIVL